MTTKELFDGAGEKISVYENCCRPLVACHNGDINFPFNRIQQAEKILTPVS